MANNGECETLCSSVPTSTCVDVALMSQSAPEGVQSTVNKTLMLDCIPIPYVAFQQLFFKDNVFKPNKVLSNQNTLFGKYLENSSRFITTSGGEEEGSGVCSTVGRHFNLFKEMVDLYTEETSGGSNTLASCWDTCSKIKFTKSVSKIKKLTDLTHVCPVECSLTLDDMFCALEANDTDLLTIDPATNMPEPPDKEDLACPPQLINTPESNNIILYKDQFVYITDKPEEDHDNCDIKGPKCITIDISACECDEDQEDKTYYHVQEMQNQEYIDCDGNAVERGTILVSGIYIDGLYGTGGQYVIDISGAQGPHQVKYWEQSAVVNITTRLTGKVPLLDATAADAARAAQKSADTASNTDHDEVVIANKGVVLDVVWRFKVDLTPASSGTAGDNHTKVEGRKAHGWSYPDYRHSDDRQRKSIPHDESLKLAASLEKILRLAMENRDQGAQE